MNEAGDGGGASQVSLGTPMRIVGRRYHAHFPGLVYIATTIMLAFGAVQSQNNLLFWAFGIAVAGLLISGVVSGAALMGLQMSRLAVSETNAGKTIVVRYALANRNRLFPAMALNIEELDASDASRLSGPIGSCDLVSAGTVVECQARARAKARGRGTLKRVRVWTTYPFGLTRKSVTFAMDKPVLVLPHAPRLRAGTLDRLLGADQRGVLTAGARGASDEFWSLREYRVGDPTRSMAWRASARTGQLIVRQTAALTPVRLWVQISEHSPARFELGIALAAGLVRQADELGWSVGLWIPSAGVLIVPGQGPRHVGTVMRALALAESGFEAKPMGPGPKPGDAVITILESAGDAPTGGRVSIGLDHAGEFLDAGESLETPAGGSGESSVGARAMSWLLGPGGAAP